MIAYGSITISDLSEPFSVIVSNDSIHISTDSNRVSSGAQTYTCDIVVYQGTAQKTNFSIGTIQAPSFLTTTKTANSVKFAVNSNTTITADNGTIIIPITMEGSTVNKSVTWSCAKEGIPAKAVDIYSNGLVFKSSDGGENFSPNIIRLTPIFQGGLSFNKWQYSLDNGITWKDVVDGEYGLKISDSIGKLVVSNKTLSVYADYMVTDSTLNIIDGGSVSGAKLSLKSRSVITTHSLLIAKDCALFNNSITSIVFKCLSNDDKYYDTTTVLRLHDVDDIEVGGVNLLTNTASVKQYTSDLCNWTIESKNNVSKNILDAETDSQRIVTSNATNPESGFYSVISGIQFKRKQHYVYSLAIRGTINQSTLFGMKIFYKNTSGKIVSSSDILWINDGDSVNDGISQFYFSRRYLPFTIPTDFDEVSNYLAVCLYGTNMDVQIRNFQLEKGLNPSPWRQADGDVVSTDTSITTIATVESIVDKINGEISNKISRTDTIDYKDENGQIVSSTISNFFSESTQNLYGFIWKVFNTSSGSTELSLTDGMIQAITNQFIIKDSNGKSVIIEKGNIKSHAITSLELATDAIKSLNYVADKNFSKAGTFIDLSNGIISTPSFYIDSTGTAAFKGDITTDSGNIGGFVIGASAIHSKDKSSVASISQGIYFANDGQFNFGNASQYVKFYRVSEGKYKLAIAVEDLFIGSSNVADAIEDAKKTADSAASVASSASSAASTANSTANAAKSTAEGASKTASDAKSTADSASQVASNASSVAGTAKTTADNASKAASEANSTASTAKTTADQAKSTADTATKNLTALTAQVKEAETTIKKNKEEIELRAKKTEVTEAIDNIDIGGRNLILLSDNPFTNNNYLTAIYNPSSSLISGITYSVSICITPAKNVSSIRVYLSLGYSELCRLRVSGANKQILNATFVAGYYKGMTPEDNPDNAKICIYRFPNNDTVTGDTTVHWIKIEKGNKATDWSPAPEDYYTKTETDASIQVLSDKISQQVSTTDKLGTRLSKVEQNSDGWSVTLETANAAKSAADKANTAASHAQSTADTARKEASNAAKTATNYMKFDNSGLTVGDLTKNTLGRNVNIDSSSVNIRNGSNVLASFAESLIEIGKNTNTATISFLNGIVKLIGQKQTIEGTTFYDAHLLSTDMMTIGTGSTDPSSDKVNALISLNGMSGEREVLASVTDAQGHSTLTVRDSSASLYSDGDAGYSSVNVITNKSTSQVEIRTNDSNGNRALINYSHAIQYYNNSTLLAAYNGKTPCLWDGFQYPMESTPVTLSAPISTQPHGVLLMFALWDDKNGSGTNNFCASYFIPKTCLNYWHYVPVFWQDMWRCGTKTIYVEDTQIKGHSHNYQQGTGVATNIKYTSSWFVLRRVYGI